MTNSNKPSNQLRGKMTVYETFCGIGGFSLGFKGAGFEIIGGCEIDPYARAIYAKNFGIEPDGDIRTIQSIHADILCGGFPCQDISLANTNRKGLDGERSGLWWELARIIENSSPRWVVLENVPALLHSGMGDILMFFSKVGYDVEWDCLPAAAFGAPHQRDRVWIVGRNTDGNNVGTERRILKGQSSTAGGVCENVSNTKSERFGEKGKLRYSQSEKRTSSICENVPYATSQRLEGWLESETSWEKCSKPTSSDQSNNWWNIEPDVGRVAHGVPNRTHRIRCLGNAIVPQISEWIANRIKEIEMTQQMKTEE